MSENDKTARPKAVPGFSSGTREQGGSLLETGMMQPPQTPGILGAIGKYQVIRVIGEGGTGQVLLARDPVTDSLVAIKIIKPEYHKKEWAVHRFLTEARHMFKLAHPSIIRILEVSDRPEGPYFIMPFMAGGSLAQKIKPGEPLPSDRIARIARQVAEALQHAHARGIIHRNLKPSNVLLNAEGEACLSDCGLLRALFNDSAGNVAQVQTHETVSYMSPAVADGRAEDTRYDIYSFGCLLYEMLTGQPPYLGPDADSILKQIQAGPPRPIRQLNRSAPSRLVAIAEGAMARELRDRYAAMSDVVSDLDRVAQGKEPLGPHGRASGSHLGLRIVAVVGMVAMLGLVVVGALYLRNRRLASETPTDSTATPAATAGAFPGAVQNRTVAASPVQSPSVKQLAIKKATAMRNEAGRWVVVFPNGRSVDMQGYAERYGGTQGAISHVRELLEKDTDPERINYRKQQLIALEEIARQASSLRPHAVSPSSPPVNSIRTASASANTDDSERARRRANRAQTIERLKQMLQNTTDPASQQRLQSMIAMLEKADAQDVAGGQTPPTRRIISRRSISAQFSYTTNNSQITVVGIKYVGSGKATVPDKINGLPVVSIGDSAFTNCTTLTSVTIPGSVTNIGNRAFWGCTNLASVYFDGNAPTLSVGSSAFDPSSKATVCYLPGSTGWGKEFGGRPTIAWVVAGQDPGGRWGVQYSDGRFFTAQDYAASYGGLEQAMSDVKSRLATPLTPEQTAYVQQMLIALQKVQANRPTPIVSGDYAYFTNATGQITISSFNTNYSGTLSITNILGGRPVSSIGLCAFWNCAKLTSVIIPNSVTNIEGGAFGGCGKLTSVYFNGDTPSGGSDTSIFRGSYNAATRHLPGVSRPPPLPGASGGFYTPVFHGNYRSAVYYLPGTKGWGNAYGGWPAYLLAQDFGYTTESNTITIASYLGSGGAVAIPSAINGFPVTSIGDNVFRNYTNLTSVTIPNSVTNLGNGAFAGCVGLTSADIPAAVMRIGDGMFQGCLGLTNVTIGAGVSRIGGVPMPFPGAPSPTMSSGVRRIGGVPMPGIVTRFGGGAFFNCPALVGINVAALNTNYSSLDGVLFNKDRTTLLACPGGKVGSYTVPAGVTSIGDSAFSFCTNVTDVTIPIGVTNIGWNAFSGCSGLTNITIPSSVTSIGYGAFENCVRLPDSVLTRVIELAPKNVSIFMSRGSAKTAMGDYDGAIADYSRVIELNPRDSRAYVERGSAKNDKGDHDGAIADYNRAIELNSRSTSTYFARGRAYSAKRDWAAALADLNRSSSPSLLGRDYPRYFIWIIRTRLGEKEAADKELLAHFDKRLSSAPADWQAKIAGHLLDKVSEAEFFAAASSPNAEEERGRRCEAWYYAGMKRLLAGDKITAADYFHKCLATERRDFVEYGAAKAELRAIEQPTSPASSNRSAAASPASGGNADDARRQSRAQTIARLKQTLQTTTDPAALQRLQSYITVLERADAQDAVDGGFNCTTNNNQITIARYSGPGGAVTIPSTIHGLPVTSIGCQAFLGCRSLTSVTIPGSVNSIGINAFMDCAGLTSVKIPNGVRSIWRGAFSGCSSLTEVNIPSSVTCIWGSAFSECSKLTAITVDAANANYSNVDGVLFDKSQTTFVQCPAGRVGSYTIPSSVTGIWMRAFSGCRGLTAVTIPSSVTSIGEYAFSGCTSLISIAVDAANASYDSVDGVLFNKNHSSLIQCPTSRGGSYTISNTVISIGNGAFFGCDNLTSVTIPSSVKSIGSGAFSGCSGLTSVTIPSSVTNIEEYAFQGCSGLTSVTIPHSLTTIREWAFSGCSKLTGVTIPSNVTRIEGWAFCDCTGLTNVAIPRSVIGIGESAFYGCSGLTNANLNAHIRALTAAWSDPAVAEPTSQTNPHLKTWLEKHPKTDANGDGILTASEFWADLLPRSATGSVHSNESTQFMHVRTDLATVLTEYSERTKLSPIGGPNMHLGLLAPITYRMSGPLTQTEVIAALECVMLMSGFAIEPADEKSFKLSPLPPGAMEGIPVEWNIPAHPPRPVSPAPAQDQTRSETNNNHVGDDIRLKFVGTWTHNIPWIDGKERTLILKCSQDAQGGVHCEFVQQFFSYRPVFTECIATGGQIEIRFKMVLYDKPSNVSPHTLKYVLREGNGGWSGQFFQSWVKSPVDVILRKQP